MSVWFIILFSFLCPATESRSELTGSSVVAFDNDTFVLTCNLADSKISWYRNGGFMAHTEAPGPGIACITSDWVTSNYQFKCRSHQLEIQSVDFDKEKDALWRCESVLNASNFAVYTIKTGLRLETVNLTLNGFSSPQLQKQEGETMFVICKTPYVYPAPTLGFCINYVNTETECFDGSATLNEDNDYWLTQDVEVTADMDGSKIYCKGNNSNAYLISMLPKLRVLYSPVLNITEEKDSTNNSMLICSAKGQPENITFLPWEHYLNHQLVREVNGYVVSGNVYVLNVSPELPRDTGTYICTASNTVVNMMTGEVNTVKYHKLDLKVELYIYDVKMPITAFIGEPIDVSTLFVNESEIIVTWYHDDIEIIDSARITLSTAPSHISHPYNSDVTIPVTESTCTISGVTQSDGGNYVCQMCSTDRCENSSILLYVSGTHRSTLATNTENSTKKQQKVIYIIIYCVCAIVGVVVILVVLLLVARNRKSVRQQGLDVIPMNAVVGGQKQDEHEEPIPENIPYVGSNAFKQTRDTNDIPNQRVDTEEPIIMDNELYISADLEKETRELEVHRNEVIVMDNDLYISADLEKETRELKVNSNDVIVMDNDLYISADLEKETRELKVDRNEVIMMDNELYISADLDKETPELEVDRNEVIIMDNELYISADLENGT